MPVLRKLAAAGWIASAIAPAIALLLALPLLAGTGDKPPAAALKELARLEARLEAAPPEDKANWRAALEALRRRLANAGNTLPGARLPPAAPDPQAARAESEAPKPAPAEPQPAAPKPREAAPAAPAPPATAKDGDGNGNGPTRAEAGESKLGKRIPMRPGPLERLGAIAREMAAGTWRELPGDPATTLISREEALRISKGDAAAAERLWGWGGPAETFHAYAGAAFDGRRLYFFGGGHHHYRGNDIKVYDLKTLSWSRLYDPAYVTDETFISPKRFVPERGPRAVHSYDSIIYTPKTNSIYLWSSRGRSPWRFDLGVFEATGDPWQAWRPFAWPDMNRPEYMFFQTALLPDGDILLVGAAGSGIATVFDPASMSYAPLSRTTGTFSVLEWDAARQLAYAANNHGGLDAYGPGGSRARENVTKAPPGLGDDLKTAGVAYDSRRQRLAFWTGHRDVWTWDPAANRWLQFTNRQGPAPDRRRSPGTWSKWVYVPQHDIFVGMAYADQGLWAYKPVDAPPPDPRRDEWEAQGFTCADPVSGWNCPDLQSQVDAGRVRKGIYNQCARVDRPVDFNGAHLVGRVCGGKAALIARDGAVIRNVDISDVTINLNANCIRWEGGTVELHNVHCARADMGLLGKGTRIVIADSVFETTHDKGQNYGHLVYTVEADEVVIRDSVLRDPGDEGHVLKTGAAATIVESSELAGGSRPYSRVIDAFNGGRLVVRDSRLVAGSHGGNGDLIGYGAETRRQYAENAVAVEGGTVDCSAALVWHSLHLWRDKVVPASIVWRPERNIDCPRVE